VRIVILGVGDAFTARHFGASALIETSSGAHGPSSSRGDGGRGGKAGRGGRVLLDCPDPIHRVLRESTKGAVRVDDIDDIVLTHIHGDHCNGLESFGFWRWMKRQTDAGSPVPRIWTSPWTAERLWRKLSPAMSGEGRRSGEAGPPTRDLSTFFDVRTLAPGGLTVQVQGLTIEARWTTHPIPTMGLLLSEGGRTLGWAGDTAFERAHIDWLSKADVIVHEANTGPAHTPIEDLNALPDELREKMRLIHLPDDFDPSRTDIAILREGDVLEL